MATRKKAAKKKAVTKKKVTKPAKKVVTKAAPMKEKAAKKKIPPLVLLYTTAPVAFDQTAVFDAEETGVEWAGVAVRKVCVAGKDEEDAARLAAYQRERYDSGRYVTLDEFEFAALSAAQEG